MTRDTDYQNQCNYISIHTPTQGVTNPTDHLVFNLGISIHTPTQGVTGRASLLAAVRPDFNPHSHAGSDGRSREGRKGQQISIHTPTQGVTIHSFLIKNVSRISIHTPTQGVTIVGARRVYSTINFNPHSHAGSDTKVLIKPN